MATGNPSATPSSRKSRKTNKPAHNRKLNERKVQELASLGVCPADIAKHQGVDHSAVWQFLKRKDIERKQIAKYKEDRADLFAALQGKALAVQEQALDHLLGDGVFASLDDRAKASVLNTVNNIFGTAYDKERLERGQSTSNVSMMGKIMATAVERAFTSPQPGDKAQSRAPKLGAGHEPEQAEAMPAAISVGEIAGVRGEQRVDDVD